MMTVLQVLPALKSGGVERGTVEIATALVKAGHRALVASSGGSMVAEITAAGATHLTLPLQSKNPFMIWANTKRLVEIIEREKVSLIHARSRAPAWSAFFAAKQTGIPFITTYHAAYNISSKPRHWWASVMAKGDRVIAISNYVANILRESFGVPEERIRLIYRGFDHAAFTPSDKVNVRAAQLKKEWGLPEGLPIILCPGRVSRTKGQDVLVKALAYFPHPCVCVLAGDQRGRADVVAGIKTAAATGAVKLFMPGAYWDGPAVMALADVVVTPATLPEAFGRTTAEAQAMGKLVISTNNGAAPEIVTEGETGWLVEASNPLQLAAALQKFFALTPLQRKEMEAQARTEAIAKFDTVKMCAETLRVYEEIIGA
jgi:glycosyltransferase involved in cell wall biosynthesis